MVRNQAREVDVANPEILVEIWRLEGSRRHMALERRRRRLESSAQVCASDVCAESDRNCTGNGRSGSRRRLWREYVRGRDLDRTRLRRVSAA